MLVSDDSRVEFPKGEKNVSLNPEALMVHLGRRGDDVECAGSADLGPGDGPLLTW